MITLVILTPFLGDNGRQKRAHCIDCMVQQMREAHCSCSKYIVMAAAAQDQQTEEVPEKQEAEQGAQCSTNWMLAACMKLAAQGLQFRI